MTWLLPCAVVHSNRFPETRQEFHVKRHTDRILDRTACRYTALSRIICGYPADSSQSRMRELGKRCRTRRLRCIFLIAELIFSGYPSISTPKQVLPAPSAYASEGANRVRFLPHRPAFPSQTPHPIRPVGRIGCISKQKQARNKRTCKNLWRRDGDSNPRYAFGAYTISNRAPSASSDISPYSIGRIQLMQRQWSISKAARITSGFAKN